jgi:hypothetical protein
MLMPGTTQARCDAAINRRHWGYNQGDWDDQTNCSRGAGGGTCANGDSRLDTRVNADGTTTPFSIPSGMVLVITEAQGRVDDGTITDPGNGHNGQVVIYRSGPSSVAEISVDIGPLGSVGLARNAFSAPPHSFPSGVVVKSGTDICVGGLDLGTQTAQVGNGVLHGFLTKDK